MTMQDKNSWKDKYISLLAENEQLQQNRHAQVQLLQRALVRSLLAAEGMDPVLDQALVKTRQNIDQLDDPDTANRLLEQLEEALLQSESRQQQGMHTLQQSLSNMTEQLLQLRPDNQLRKSLQNFRNSLGKAAMRVHLLPQQLQDLSQLQATALSHQPDDEDETQPRSFFGFLRKNPKAGRSGIPPQDHNEHDSRLDDAAGQIQGTLLRLLNKLPHSNKQQAKISSLRQRIEHDYNLQQLPHILDDLAQIMDQHYSSGQEQMQQYLSQLNKRLSRTGQSLQEAQARYRQTTELSDSFDQQMQSQVHSFGRQLQQHDDLQALKQSIDQQLSLLQQTLGDYSQQRSSDEQSLLQRFTVLQQRMQKMEQQTRELNRHLAEQRQMAMQDTLTGVANRAAWDERFAQEHARVQRSQEPACLAVLDIDFFKQVNDKFGHAAGDKVLKIFADKISQNIRQTDFFARYGGEEFVLLLTNTDLATSIELVDQLRKKIEQTAFHFKGEPVRVTFSAGVGQLTSEPANDTFIRVDQALYQAKNQGRNRVVSA